MSPSPSKRRRYKRYRSNYRISEFDRKKIEEMYYQGITPPEMARILGFSDKTTYRYCTKIFAPVNGGWARGFPSQSERNDMCRHVIEGKSFREVAEMYNRPVWVVVGASKPKGIASLTDITITPNDMFVSPKPLTFMERAGQFFRRLFGGR